MGETQSTEAGALDSDNGEISAPTPNVHLSKSDEECVSVVVVHVMICDEHTCHFLPLIFAHPAPIRDHPKLTESDKY